ncbi:hypothetical protein Micbo1qcDRAFT_168679 [Microdochium bolleyi]|uniref:Secreted protein n=1 Tax=Microdochium bolleyi TaxID=196109 RepID=A0A136IN38_9PEZI|nr:hypothetical protein Micbo1qcDRAFT_168679 [Microdochium bolleyi]
MGWMTAMAMMMISQLVNWLRWVRAGGRGSSHDQTDAELLPDGPGGGVRRRRPHRSSETREQARQQRSPASESIALMARLCCFLWLPASLASHEEGPIGTFNYRRHDPSHCYHLLSVLRSLLSSQ